MIVFLHAALFVVLSPFRPTSGMSLLHASFHPIGLYRDVWIAAIASSRKSPATQTAAICVRFQGRRVRHVNVTMHVTFLTRISALIYRRGLRQRVASLTLDCNGVFAIRAYGWPLLRFIGMSTSSILVDYYYDRVIIIMNLINVTA